jgi:RNA polymerase sigma factor (sigma-70 family)
MRKAVGMASQEQLRKLTSMVLEALDYRRNHNGGDNGALGRAILYVDSLLLPWARSLAAGEFDVEDMVADAGFGMLAAFPTFRGITGKEFFNFMRTIVERAIARMWRLLEAEEKGCLRRSRSLEGDAETARLVERLASREHLPDIAAMIHENGRRLRRVMRGLTVDQQRVLRMHGIDDCPFQEIAATFGHSASWAHDVWEAAAAEIRSRLMRPSRPRQRRRVAMAIAGS